MGISFTQNKLSFTIQMTRYILIQSVSRHVNNAPAPASATETASATDLQCFYRICGVALVMVSALTRSDLA